MGSQNLRDNLPRLIKEVKNNKKTVIWSCDPCMQILINLIMVIKLDHLIKL